jgi:hypothetical protein
LFKGSINNLDLGINPINYNMLIGLSNLIKNKNGYNNTAIGFQTLQNNSNGNNNTAIGYKSL